MATYDSTKPNSTQDILDALASIRENIDAIVGSSGGNNIQLLQAIGVIASGFMGLQVGNTANARKVRCGLVSATEGILTINCGYNGSSWQRDDTSTGGIMLYFATGASGGALRIYAFPSGSNPIVPLPLVWSIAADGTVAQTNDATRTGVEVGVINARFQSTVASQQMMYPINFRNKRTSVPTVTLATGSTNANVLGKFASDITVNGFGFTLQANLTATDTYNYGSATYTTSA